MTLDDAYIWGLLALAVVLVLAAARDKYRVERGR